ncbi:MAG: hypothetical protein LDLANPLL_01092 [Turneriella sp.]|nr:hypothetical protein [Turneriella sp.]
MHKVVEKYFHSVSSKILLLLFLSAPLWAKKQNVDTSSATTTVDETTEEETPAFPLFWQILLREEPGYAVARKDSLLNPDDFLGLPRVQNRVLASVDLKLPIIGGGGINPVLELVVADTFLYLQYEGHESLAKPSLSHAQNFLKEAYLNFRPSSFWLLSLGRKNITDGVGYSRNVVDFLANPTTLPGFNLDNRVRIKNREGTILLRNEFLWKGGSFSYTYVPEFTQSNYSDAKVATEIDRLTQFNRKDAHWVKLYEYVWGIDLSLHYFYRNRHNAGVTLAKVFGDALELHGEVRVQEGSAVQTVKQLNDDIYVGPTLVQGALYTFEERSSGKAYVRSLVGAQYTFENKLNLSIEYYFNGEGYNASQMNLFYNALGVAGSRYDNSAFIFGTQNPYRLFLLAANQNFAYLSLGMHYAFMRLYDPELFGSNKWEGALYTSVLVTDGSGLLAGELTYKMNDYVSLQLLVNGFWGVPRSEGGAFYQTVSALIAAEAQF